MYRVIVATGTWLGGRPWHKDRFMENAAKNGLEILHDPSVEMASGKYVVLDQDYIFYHATRPEYVDSILKQGLKCQSADGLQATGVYLTGGATDLADWFGEDETVVLQVRVPKGTKVYRDYQANAVFIRNNISPSRIKLLN